jgi:hypothetical protein
VKVVIKTPDGLYVGGGQSTQLVSALSRAYVYDEKDDHVDEQITIVNAMYHCGWFKVSIEDELDGREFNR